MELVTVVGDDGGFGYVDIIIISTAIRSRSIQTGKSATTQHTGNILHFNWFLSAAVSTMYNFPLLRGGILEKGEKICECMTG